MKRIIDFFKREWFLFTVTAVIALIIFLFKFFG